NRRSVHMAGIKKYFEDPEYWLVKRGIAYMTGKQVAHFLAEAISDAGVAIGSIAGHSLAGALTIGGATAVSAGLVQWDYMREKKEVGEFYKEEIKAKGTNLDTFIKTNTVAAEKEKQLRKERTTGIIISALATLTALAAVSFGFPFVVEHVFNITNLAPTAS